MEKCFLISLKDKECIDFPNSDVENLFIKIIDREFCKGWTMRYLYSETDYTRIKYLDRILYNSLKSTITFDVRFKLCQKVSLLFVETFKENYPEIYNFSIDIKKRMRDIKKKDRIPTYILGTSSSANGFKSTLDVRKRYEKHYDVWSETKKSSVQTVLRDCKPDINIEKCISSLVPNLVHHLDSVLVYACVNELKRKGINVFVVHDCFYLSKKHEKLIKTLYYEAFITNIIKNPCYKNFLALNNIILSDEDALSYNSFIINTDKYEMSPFVLT